MNPESSEPKVSWLARIVSLLKLLATIVAIVVAATTVIILLLFGIPWGVTQVAPLHHGIPKEIVWYVLWFAILFGWATANVLFGWAQSDEE